MKIADLIAKLQALQASTSATDVMICDTDYRNNSFGKEIINIRVAKISETGDILDDDSETGDSVVIIG